MSKEYGKLISPVLAEIHDSLWEIDARESNEPYNYTEDAIRSALKITMSVSMDRLWKNQEEANTPMEDRSLQAELLGLDLKQLFEKHLGIDTHKLYGEKKK